MIKKLMRKLFSDKGQALVETVLLITLISALAIGGFALAGNTTSGILSDAAQLLSDGGSDPYDFANVSIAEIPDQTYTGEPIEPELEVTAPDGTVLVSGTDYTTEYLNNIDIGTATAALTGIGNWHGSKSAEFNIVGTVIESVPTQSGTLTYRGSAQSPSWSGYDSSMLSISGNTSGTNAGSYTAQFTPKYGFVWADGTSGAKPAVWTIGKLDLSKATVSCSNISDWMGGTKQSAPTVKVNGTTVSSSLYSVSYSTSDPSTTSPYRSNCSATVTAATNANVIGSKTASYTVTRKLYYVYFNANGGSGAPQMQTKAYNVDLTLSSTKPTRSGYDFVGWGIQNTSTSATYQAGDTYRNNSGWELYAVWKQKINVTTTLAWSQANTKTANAKYVSFLGKTWIVIGCNGNGVYSTANTITLLLSDVAGNTNYAIANQATNYASSGLRTSMQNYWNTIKSTDSKLANVVQPRTLEHGNYISSSPWCDGIPDTSSLSGQYLWPLSTAEAVMLAGNNTAQTGSNHGIVTAQSDSVTQASSWWWLRSPGNYYDFAAFVYGDGAVATDGESMVSYGGSISPNEIRPALRASTSTLTITSGSGSKSNPYVLAVS